MRPTTIALVSGLALAVAGARVAAADPAAREEAFRITEVKVSTQAPPDATGSAAPLGGPGEWAKQRWLVIDVTFATEPDWVDDLDLKFYVLLGADRPPQLFTGDLTLVSLKKSRRHYAALFMHPGTLARFGGDKPKAVAVLAYHQGKRVAAFSAPENQPYWWDRFTPVTGHLLPPAQTPWALLAHQRYEAVKAGP